MRGSQTSAMSDYYYVILSSDDSAAIYPENKMANFRVKLARPMDFEPGMWEVACLRFSYTNSLCTFNSPQSVFLVDVQTREKHAELVLYPKQFNSVAHITQQINTQLKEQVGISATDRLPVLKFDAHNRLRQSIGKIGSKRYRLEFSDSLRIIMGEEREGYHYLDACRTDLYLYIDCVATKIVGDVNVPLLTTLDIGSMPSKPGEQSTIKIKAPEYTTVAHSQVDEIEVQLLDDVGREPSFQYGRITVTLHFRRRK